MQKWKKTFLMSWIGNLSPSKNIMTKALFTCGNIPMKCIDRRNALRKLGALSTTFVMTKTLASKVPSENLIRFGLIADLHGGLASDAEMRLGAFLNAMKPMECDALIQLGDFAYPNSAHKQFANKFHAAHQETIHVIGNHEFDHGLDRKDIYDAWGIESSYYRRDVAGIRILVLDGNESGSPTHRGGYPSYIGPDQQAWLEEQLKESTKPILILSHQPLAGRSSINNANEIQQLIGRHRSKVIACLNGHSHLDAMRQVNQVPYLHINSASYYWVGGKTRMAYYTDPLFTTLTIDPKMSTVRVEASHSSWKDESPSEMGYFQTPNRPEPSTVVPRISERQITLQ